MNIKRILSAWTNPQVAVQLSPEVSQWILAVSASFFKQVGYTGSATSLEDLKLELAERKLGCTLSEAYQADASEVGQKLFCYLGDNPFVLLAEAQDKALVLYQNATAPVAIALPELSALKQSGPWMAIVRNSAFSPEESFGWKWFGKQFSGHNTVLRDILIASLVIQLIGLAFPLATQTVVDKVITNQATSTLIALMIGLVIFAMFNGSMSWLRQKLVLRLANVIDSDLSLKVLHHMFHLPLKFFERRSTGTLLAKIRGIERVREFFSSAFILVCLELPFMLIFLGLMLSYSLLLSGIVLFFVSVMTFFSFMVGPKLRTLANTNFEASAHVQAYLTEHVAAYETIKSLQLEKPVAKQFSALNTHQLDASLAMREFASGYSTIMQVLEQMMNLSVLGIGAWSAMQGDGITIGMLVAFQMFAQRVAQPLLKVSGMWQEFQQVRTAVTQMGDIMLEPIERYSAAATSTGGVKGSISAQGLGFRHTAESPYLYQNFSFDIPAGEIVLVTGPSGSGKSTLAKILLRMYPDYEGQVLLDGRDTRTMGVNELRSFFGVVPQETTLFSGTILENLLSAVASASFEEAVAACKMAGIHEAILNMRDGYQTKLGERGVGLSGGQRQRIGIARALLRRPRVLIFDEATSGLDNVSAEHIGETVNRLRGHATVVFVAHKVPQCLKFDKHIEIGRKSS